MSWTLIWHPAARWGLLNKFPARSTAERLDAAIIAYAETGRGPVQQVAPPDARRLAIMVEGAGALLFLDPGAGTVTVRHVFHRR